jgi:hypothetical protein
LTAAIEEVNISEILKYSPEKDQEGWVGMR